METAADPGQVILDRIALREVERAKLEAQTAADLLEFHDLRRREAESTDNPVRRDLEVSFAADELALVLLQPTRVVQCRLAEARRVRNLLPTTWLAFATGRVDAYRVSLIASAAGKLTDNHSMIELDHYVADYAATHTGSQTKAWLRRFVARCEPDRAAERARDEKTKRFVRVEHQDDGMSYLNAYLPTQDAVRIEQLLTNVAKSGPTDGRTFDQRRADAFVSQFFTTGDESIGSRAVIGITVPLTTLTGLSDQPGESFDGAFALPAGMVRDLAAEPGTLFYRILTDPAGRILDTTELGRFPSARLRTSVQARDGTCLFPTCSLPAMDCDLDHDIPHPRGPTSGANLGPLCRRHHQMKTHEITNPRTVTVHPRTRSRMELEFATWLTRIDYAA